VEDNCYKQFRISQVDKSPWRSFVIFLKIAGKWWFSVWVVVILAGIATLALTIAKVSQLPTSVWGTLIIIGFVIAPVIAFHFLRVERDTYFALWDDKAKIMNILGAIEKLRKEAAPLHIRGMCLSTIRTVNKWTKEVDDWTKRSIDTVKLLHPAEAGNLETLGVFNVDLAVGTKPFNAQHLSTIRNLVRRMTILAEIRDRWTTRTSI